ncbi:MAG: FecR domain-containing protein [Dysgonamonadaceae bacterium]|nr:FecR domain-containing protein [Dysgonamonadaceae bacterium]
MDREDIDINDIDIEGSMDQILDLMESPDCLTENELRMLIEDSECLKVCNEMFECKRAVLEEFSFRTPHVNKEWNKFREKTSHRPKTFWLTVGGLTGIAASFLLFLLFSWVKNEWFDTNDAAIVFQASDRQQEVTLKTVGGGILTLDDAIQNATLQNLGATLEHGDSTMLVYNKVGKVSARVETHVLTTPRGQDFKVTLSDGSQVWMNAESQLEYPSQFVGGKRVVRLHGEAYFQVAKDEAHPFIVEADGLQTAVVGTEFNIRNYSTDNSHVTLINGSVEVRSNKQGALPIRISPGENARLQSNGTFMLEEVDIDPYIYWKEGYFYFDNISLKEIMQEIGRWYNVNIVFENRQVLEYKLHYFCARNSGLDYAMILLNRMKKFHVWKDGNTVYVK